MPIQFLPYAKQSINEDDMKAMAKLADAAVITRGPVVEKFEKSIAKYCGANYAVAFNSGTSALLAACKAVDVGIADRVISTPNSFVASCGSAIQAGATPIFVDIDRSTGNLNLNLLKSVLSKKYSRGRSIIIPVHFSGIAVDMAYLESMVADPDAVIIEDACHAIGSYYPDGKKVGSCAYSDMTVFSFHPAKTITTGEGGIVTTNDKHIYSKLKLFRNNGIERYADISSNSPYPGHYEVEHFGNNYNFTEFQASLGLSQLQRIDSFIEKRRKLVKAYRKGLKGIANIELFSDAADNISAYHLFVVQINFEAIRKTKLEFMKKLDKIGIGTQVHYIPIYQHPAFVRKFGHQALQFPEMELYYSRALTLPLYPDLTYEDVDRIIKEVKRLLK